MDTLVSNLNRSCSPLVQAWKSCHWVSLRHRLCQSFRIKILEEEKLHLQERSDVEMQRRLNAEGDARALVLTLRETTEQVASPWTILLCSNDIYEIEIWKPRCSSLSENWVCTLQVNVVKDQYSGALKEIEVRFFMIILHDFEYWRIVTTLNGMSSSKSRYNKSRYSIHKSNHKNNLQSLLAQWITQITSSMTINEPFATPSV